MNHIIIQARRWLIWLIRNFIRMTIIDSIILNNLNCWWLSNEFVVYSVVSIACFALFINYLNISFVTKKVDILNCNLNWNCSFWIGILAVPRKIYILISWNNVIQNFSSFCLRRSGPFSCSPTWPGRLQLKVLRVIRMNLFSTHKQRYSYGPSRIDWYLVIIPCHGCYHIYFIL